MTQQPVIIGLTGGIASGKSTVAKFWRKRGVSIIDADQVAREVVEQGQDAYEAIREEFGEEIIASTGQLDRAALGRIVFADPQRLEVLNNIVHPAMMNRITQLVHAYQKSGVRWIVYEAALIIEKGLSPTLSEVICVLAQPETQLKRLMVRNSMTETEAQERMAAQTDNATRRQASDHVIDNDGSIAELEHLADIHLTRLIETYGSL